MVRLEDVIIRRRGRRILGPVSVTLDGASVTSIVGRNGSGKSTLLRLLHGLERPRSGQVHWDSVPDRKAESFVFQTPTVLRRNVRANLELPLRLRGLPLDDVDKMAAEFGLMDLLNRPAHDLSGGERQRVALVRALLTNPARVFMDEPTANLDQATTALVEDWIARLASRSVRVILSTHSPRQLQRIGGTVLFVDDGRVEGPISVSDFMANPTSDAAQDWITGD